MLSFKSLSTNIFLSVLSSLCLCITSATCMAQNASYTGWGSEIEQLWAGVERLAESGDSVGAVRAMERVEKVCKTKYTSLKDTEEWMSQKARIYGFHLHNLDSAYDIQMRASELLIKSSHHQLISSSSMKACIYALHRGWYYYAYANGLVVLAEKFKLDDKNPGQVLLSFQYLVRSSLALHKYKETLSYTNWLLHSEYKYYQQQKDSFKRYAFYSLAECAGFKIEADLKLGYTDDAQRTMVFVDSLANAINAKASSVYDKVKPSAYALFPRIRLLCAQQKYAEALEYARLYKPSQFLDIVDRLDVFDEVIYRLLLVDIYRGLNNEGAVDIELDKAAECMWNINSKHPLMAEVLCQYAAHKSRLNPIVRINMLGEARRILRHCNLEGSSYETDVYQQVAICGNKTEELQRFMPRWILHVTRGRLDELRNEFVECTSNERLHVWNNGPYQDWFQNFLPQFICEHPEFISNDTVMGCINAGIQTSKSLLIHSDLRMRELIGQKQDPSLKRAYNQLTDLKQQLLNQKVDERSRFKELKDSIYNLDNFINGKLNLHADVPYLDRIAISNSYVSKIRPGNLYIDFVRYVTREGVAKYAAFISLREQGEQGVMPVYLFDETELQEVIAGDVFNNSRLHDLVWKKLEPSFKLLSVKNIYFSASGELHNLTIEYVPDSKGKSLSDKYQVYRVMSTKEAILAEHQSPKSQKKQLSVWGNIDYSPYKTNPLFTDIADELPYSRLELKAIRKALPNGMQCHSYTELQASEERFKSIAGHHTDLLHIVTHGFYWDTTFRMKHPDLFSKGTERFNPHTRGSLSAEDASMMNSVLLLAPSPESHPEDGILTATEIAMMDLSSLDLVVLSACQTGLGDLSNEGTLGLQRAFKKAGAKSLLISLKSVHDESTYLLMSEFYRGIFSGKSKHEALRAAQHKVRSINGGMYAHPRYWAPFILIDSFD